MVWVAVSGCIGTADGKGTEPLPERRFAKNRINLCVSGKQKMVKKKTEST